MYHHIVQYLRRCEYQPVVKGERASGGTAAPAAFLVADGNGSIVATGKLMKVGNPCRKKSAGGVAIPFFQSLEALCFRLCKIYVFDAFCLHENSLPFKWIVVCESNKTIIAHFQRCI